jgi:hypothetical protein
MVLSTICMLLRTQNVVASATMAIGGREEAEWKSVSDELWVAWYI